VSTPEALGIIAGNRNLPLLLAREARAAGVKKLVAVAMHGETEEAIENLVDETVWIKVGQLGKLINGFKEHSISECVMVGQVAPGNLFNLRPDLRAVKLLMGLKTKNAHSIFGAIAKELSSEGINLIEATPWLQPAMPGEGFTVGPTPTSAQQADIKFAHQMAVEIARLDIGQTVVVKDGAVLAVEGWEGTDDCLARGGELAGKEGGAVAVKVAKPGHDFRFDIPCLGPKTLEICAASRLAVLAFEAGRTLLLEREVVERAAEQHKITVAAT
tara:strand:+ start:2343 stop:3158 length:816 start_codon:yes stop_codon:yes gene_type:complete